MDLRTDLSTKTVRNSFKELGIGSERFLRKSNRRAKKISSKFAIETKRKFGPQRLKISHLRFILGILWVTDGLLQLQPFMFSPDFVKQIILPNTLGNPPWLADPILETAKILEHSIGIFNPIFASIQLLIGIGIIAGCCATIMNEGQRLAILKLSLLASMAWSFLVWFFGEGLGGIFSQTSPLMGAPGSAFFYGLLSMVLWPTLSRGSFSPLSRLNKAAALAVLSWPAFWIYCVHLLLQPYNMQRGSISMMIAMSYAKGPTLIHNSAIAIANFLYSSDTGQYLNIVLVCLMFATGIGVFIRQLRQPSLILGIILSCLIWIFGEGMGGIFTRQSTDLNTAPLIIILALYLRIFLARNQNTSA